MSNQEETSNSSKIQDKLKGLSSKFKEFKEEAKETYNEIKNDPHLKEAVKEKYNETKEKYKEKALEKLHEKGIDTDKMQDMAYAFKEKKAEVLTEVYKKAEEIESFKKELVNVTLAGAALGFGVGCYSTYRRFSFFKIPGYTLTSGLIFGGGYYAYNKPSLSLASLFKKHEQKSE